MKKLLCVIVVLTLCFTMFVPAAAAGDDGTTAESLRFNTDGSFKILQLTDLHKNSDDKYNDVNTYLLHKTAVTVKPDLAVLTGDIAMDGTREQVLANIDAIMTVFEDLDIPVAVVFGNHDSEKGIFTREELMGIYNSYPCSVSVDDGDALPGCGTYNIPVLASGSEKTAFNLWMIDSREYDEEGRYGCVTPEQIDWYVSKSNALKAQNNGTAVNSLMFQHIIVPEIYDALTETDHWVPYAVNRIYETGRYYVLNPENTNAGRLAEYPCPPYYNNGQFDAIVGQGDVLAMFFGHDHTNTFNVNYMGVDLVATPKTKFEGAAGIDYGTRLITLNESDTGTYQTQLIPFSSLYSGNDFDFSDLFSPGFKWNSVETKTMFLVRFFTLVHQIEYFFATTLAEFVLGTKLDYR